MSNSKHYTLRFTGLLIDVKEVQCGDPQCAPIDTIFTLIWTGADRPEGKGLFAIPASPEEIDQTILNKEFPVRCCHSLVTLNAIILCILCIQRLIFSYILYHYYITLYYVN